MAGATPRHGHPHHQHGHYTPFSLTRLASFIGLSPRHATQPYPNHPTSSGARHQFPSNSAARQDLNGDWVAVAVASTSSFGGGDGTLGAADDAGAKSPLTPFMASANPFAKAQLSPPSLPQPTSHWGFTSGSHPYSMADANNSTNSFGIASGSGTVPLSRTISARPKPPRLATDPLESLRGTKSVISPPSTMSSLGARLRTSGFLHIAGPSSSSAGPSASRTSGVTNKAKIHYRQPSFAALEGGGIGESPSVGTAAKGKGREVIVKDRTREKERQKFNQKEKERTPVDSVGVTRKEKRISPSSPLMGFVGTHHTTPAIGRAMSVRTSLLGFGTQDSSSSMGGSDGVGDEAMAFGNPRKAPLPPGATSLLSDAVADTTGHGSGHARKPSEGGVSVLGPLKEDSGEMAEMGVRTVTKKPMRETIGKENAIAALASESSRRPHYVAIPPFAPSATYKSRQQPPAAAVPLPPSQASEYSDSSQQPSPVTYQPHASTSQSANPRLAQTQKHIPNEGQSTDQKPPIPPKSSQTLLRTYRTLKAYSSTPNLLPSLKGKGKEKAQQQATEEDASSAYLRRSPSAAAAQGRPNPSLLHPHMFQAQTLCDAFMFPRPRFVAHIISPPGTPGVTDSAFPQEAPVLPTLAPPTPLTLDKVIRDGEMRELERQEWAARANQNLRRNMSQTLRSRSSNGREANERLNVSSGRDGLVHRLRARTLSGRKSGAGRHQRDNSKDTAGSSKPSDGSGARIVKEKSLKVKRSYDAFLLQRQQQTSPPSTGVLQQDEVGRSISTRNTGPGPGKQGKLSIALATGAIGGVTAERTAAGSSSGGTVRSQQSQPNSHSRKSSAGAASGHFGRQGGFSHPFASHSRTASGSGSHAASVANYALRKVKSLCGPGGVSPSHDAGSFLGQGLQGNARAGPAGAEVGAQERQNRIGTRDADGFYEEDMYEALGESLIVDADRQLRPGPKLEELPMRNEQNVDEYNDGENGWGERDLVDSYDVPSRGNSALAATSHLTPSDQAGHSDVPSGSGDDAASHLDLDDGEEDETVEIHLVTRRVSMTLAQLPQSSRQSFVSPSMPIDFIRPNPTPSPSPSSYHGVYGIALGTPSQSHPFVQYFGDDEVQEVPAPSLSAGPHPTSPTYLQIPGVNDVSSRHRLPPHRPPRLPPPSASLPSPPVSSEQHGADSKDHPSEYGDEPSSLRPIYAPSSVPSSPASRAFHPYAAQASTAKNVRMSVNSVEAMFGGELLESSHTVSPLGVREAGEAWINSTDADLKALPTMMDDPTYRHSGDSGLGSSTDAHVSHARHIRGKPSRAVTMSSGGSMLVESPPPSMFPSFRQERSSAKFDTMTFGNGDNESIEEADETARQPLEDVIVEELHDLTGPRRSRASSSSSTSSIELPPKPLGSSDDMESFKDLFYVPRSRQPSVDSPKFRRYGASADSKSPEYDQQGAEGHYTGFPSMDAHERASTARLLSPLSSVMQGRDSFSDVDVAGPYRFRPNDIDGADEPHTSGLISNHVSVYDIIEEEESVRSSVEHFAEEDVRVGAISALSPNMTVDRIHRQSTQLSLVDVDDEPSAEPLPRAHPDFINIDPAFRASYLTTTSGTSYGNRMSHIISDFPSPPIHGPSSPILDYSGVSPIVENADPLSFVSPSEAVVPLRASLPFRSDSFGRP